MMNDIKGKNSNEQVDNSSILKCWDYFHCQERDCPVLMEKELCCWIVSGTHCRSEIQGKFFEKMEMCLTCEVFLHNIDKFPIYDTLKILNDQVQEFRRMTNQRDRELSKISMELAIGLSEVIESLKAIASGDPAIRISEVSQLEIVSKLKSMVNITAKDLEEIVDLSHEFAIGLAEHFDVLKRIIKGDLDARIKGSSHVELLNLLKDVTNRMIDTICKEIDERKEIERALRESEERYRTLFNSTPNSIFVLEPKTLKILDINTRVTEIYGYERVELIGKRFNELGTYEFKYGVLSSTSQGHMPRSSMYPKIQHRKKDGSKFHVDVYACQTERSRKYGIIAVTVDITDTLAKETQLIQASKMATLGEMAAGIAHELNQPLSTIQIGADYIDNVIKQGLIAPDDLSLVSKHLKEQVERAVHIITHLREFGRKTDIKREKVDVNRAIMGVFTILSQQLKLKGIKLEVDLMEDIPLVLGDLNRLEQVFINLIINARDAMEEKKNLFLGADIENCLRVRSYHERDSVVVEVSDTGVGIPDDIKDRIFEPFFTTKKLGEGTGLGLSISYNIIKDYNGRIEFDSKEGEGTTFRVIFPALEDHKDE
jgi:PAS domain S-box-containing protein